MENPSTIATIKTKRAERAWFRIILFEVNRAIGFEKKDVNQLIIRAKTEIDLPKNNFVTE